MLKFIAKKLYLRGFKRGAGKDIKGEK